MMKQASEKLWIGPQPSQADFAEAKSKGIMRIVNNRPDGEEAGQPTAAESERQAAGLGLDYVSIPIVPGQISRSDVRAFQKALSTSGGPVLAHCKTGTRSLMLWSIGEVLDGRLRTDQLDDLGRRLGIDLAGAKKWLAANS